MELPNRCTEFFLEGITDVMFYPKEECVIPVPFMVAQVLSIYNCSLPAEPTLRLATSGEHYVIVDNLTVKMSIAKQGNGTIYTYDISANVANGGKNVAEAYRNMRDKECLVVLRKMDGSLHLCYTLPNTFGIGGSTDHSQNELARTFTATTQAMSEPIPITLKE